MKSNLCSHKTYLGNVVEYILYKKCLALIPFCNRMVLKEYHMLSIAVQKKALNKCLCTHVHVQNINQTLNLLSVYSINNSESKICQEYCI